MANHNRPHHVTSSISDPWAYVHGLTLQSQFPVHYSLILTAFHDDVIKWKHFPRYWPFVRGIHRWPVNSPHKGPVMRSFDVFFDLRLNKRLSKWSRGWWFEASSRSLWRHCNVAKFLYASLPLHQWVRVAIYASVNLAIIGLDNGLSPVLLQTMIWTNAGLLVIRPMGTHFREAWIQIQSYLFPKCI